MMTNTRTRLLRRLAALLTAAVLLAGLLALDLANRGLAWQFFWQQTGEEAPLAQIRGMVEWAGNLTRPQPINDPLTPVQHANVNPYGINTFLQKEVEAVKVDQQLRLIAAAGFTWIRQEFPWEDLEVDGRGQFTDTRNDMDGDGQRDTIDAWAKYDRIVDLAEKHGIRMQVRLSNPPHWSRAEDDPRGTGPPDDLQDYVNFAVAVAQRYQGRVTHYQIWNEPNIFPEWGAYPDGSPRPVDPERYTEMLCRSYDALKAVDPQIVVISGALAPTSAISARDLNDFVFLQRMYDAGAADCFEVLSMQGYGLRSGPTDRRMRPTNVNFARSQYIRDIMVANGDAHKAIWLSEAAWNYVPPREESPDIQEPRDLYGQVTMDQAAAYMPIAYQRAQEEWPWVGVVNYWFFTHENDSRKNLAWYYFRMADPDYSPDKPTYTTLPIYDSMRDYITGSTPTLYQGTHQMAGHWALRDTDAEAVRAGGGLFGTAAQLSQATLTVDGTDAFLRWRGGPLSVQVNDGAPVVYPAGEAWRTAHVLDQLSAAPVTLTLRAGSAVLLDRVTVVHAPARKAIPYAVPVLVGVLMLGVALWQGLRGRRA